MRLFVNYRYSCRREEGENDLELPAPHRRQQLSVMSRRSRLWKWLVTVSTVGFAAWAAEMEEQRLEAEIAALEKM